MKCGLNLYSDPLFNESLARFTTVTYKGYLFFSLKIDNLKMPFLCLRVMLNKETMRRKLTALISLQERKRNTSLL